MGVGWAKHYSKKNIYYILLLNFNERNWYIFKKENEAVYQKYHESLCQERVGGVRWSYLPLLVRI